MSINTVEQAGGQSASKIGKFNTVEDLFAAYNALECEFTKRCQLIKQLQAELNELSAQADKNTNEDCKGSNAFQPEPDDQGEKGEQETKDAPPENTQPVPEVDGGQTKSATITFDEVLNEILQNAAIYAAALSAVPEIMDACIASYKQRLIRPQPAPAPAGMAVIVPAKRPRTLSDAKRLADALLAGN